MTKSAITKSYSKKALITLVLSWSLTVLPCIAFCIFGFYKGEVVQKVQIGAVASCCICLSVFMLFSKMKLNRTMFWVVMFGTMAMFDKMKFMFIVMGVCCIIDEVVVEPLHKYYANKRSINKEIDKRDIKTKKEELSRTNQV